MPYVLASKTKPVMYYDDEGVWHCKGGGVEVTANSQRGAYTRWRNKRAWLELPEPEKIRISARPALSSPPFGILGPFSGRAS